MSSTPNMTLDEEIAAAVAIVRVGLDRLRDAATRTEALGPHVAVLRALRDHRNPDAGVCAAVADVIGTITVSITETDHEAIDDVVELLNEAQAYAQDNTGERIDRALTLLAPLLNSEESR
ncbi:hypothetical protein JK359_33515 [Streptomyces actinomycinicus]|uniref:Uncharacterized protein n=1 Tax=Streptomyces actinomycinicus TaxID=1695166 RepID=A0A937EPR1_9ACTN|nr:hypothetical protein [Streptomyces actinomycinicus]MBL1086826.1 hypothetical protein [Streptomyces actinomycinicus]